MFYAKLFKAIEQNWSKLKYYVLFFAILFVFSSVMTFLKVNKIITYSVCAVIVVIAVVVLTHKSKQRVEDRKTAVAYKELIGKHGLVLEDIGNKYGKITIDGDEYAAKTSDGVPLCEYTPVEVVATDELVLIVKAQTPTDKM